MPYVWANLILMLPLSILFVLFYQRTPWRKPVTHCALLIAGFVVMLIPGVLRNAAATGEIAFMNTQGGSLLYCSNNPSNLTGRYNVPAFSRADPVASEKNFHAEAERRLGRSLTQQEVSRYWTKETLRFLRENLGAVPFLLFNKLKGTIGTSGRFPKT